MNPQTKTLEKFARRVFKNVTPNGEWVNFSCPVAPYSEAHRFKEDRSPSAGARPNKDNVYRWYCFTCKSAGSLTSLFSYLEKKQKRSYQDIIAQLEESQLLPDYEVMYMTEREDETPEPLVYTELFEDVEQYPDAYRYLEKRGISITTARKLDLQYNPDDPRIVFPVKDAKGTIFGFTSRGIEDQKPKIKNYSGFQKEYFILGMEHWKPTQPTVIVEGLFAYAHFHEITKGRLFPYNIGAIMGSEISHNQLQILINFGKPVYCFLDPDAAGQIGVFGDRRKKVNKGMAHALKDQLPTFVPKWPSDINDPDSLNYDQLYDMILHSRLAT
jgi:hypothetical protein